MKFEINIDDQKIPIFIEPKENRFTLNENDKCYSFHSQKNGRRLLRIGTKLCTIDNVEWNQNTVQFTINGRQCEVEVRDEQDILLDEMGFKTSAAVNEGQLKAPMPGKILDIMVQEDDEVELGDPVAILEAMKMENELKAPVAGTISSITAAINDSMEKNELILEIEADG